MKKADLDEEMTSFIYMVRTAGTMITCTEQDIHVTWINFQAECESDRMRDSLKDYEHKATVTVKLKD